MALRYYPLTQITTNLYTRGGEYKTPNGKEYRGRYFMTYDGRAFVGINPVLGTGEELISIQQELLHSGRTQNRDTAAYTLARSPVDNPYVDLDADSELTELRPYYPIPLDSDYARGYFTRYFAKIVSGPGYVFEISPRDWTSLQNGAVFGNILGYESIDMLWQLTGPLNDKRISQYQIQGGIYDTNKRVTESKDRVFRGLVAFIGEEYTKFARITP